MCVVLLNSLKVNRGCEKRQKKCQIKECALRFSCMKNKINCHYQQILSSLPRAVAGVNCQAVR